MLSSKVLGGICSLIRCPFIVQATRFAYFLLAANQKTKWKWKKQAVFFFLNIIFWGAF